MQSPGGAVLMVDRWWPYFTTAERSCGLEAAEDFLISEAGEETALDRSVPVDAFHAASIRGQPDSKVCRVWETREGAERRDEPSSPLLVSDTDQPVRLHAVREHSQF